jgi:membrane-associated protein
LEWINYFIDLFLHLDQHLAAVLRDYGTWTYLILFGIIFCETGFVVMPFLPGDSLLFGAGALAVNAQLENTLNPHLLFLLLSVAGILGDTVNYWIGAVVGPRAFTGEVRFLKKEYLDRTHRFYERYGGKTIIIARFVPIVRTFAPFVAGIGAMSYGRFVVYNVVGAVAWVGLFVYGGYFFANIEFVKHNFPLVILAIIIVSVMPMVVELIRARRCRKSPDSIDADKQ